MALVRSSTFLDAWWGVLLVRASKFNKSTLFSFRPPKSENDWTVRPGGNARLGEMVYRKPDSKGAHDFGFQYPFPVRSIKLDVAYRNGEHVLFLCYLGSLVTLVGYSPPSKVGTLYSLQRTRQSCDTPTF